MGLFQFSRPSFNYVTGNVTGTRPAAAFGTSITPGNNSYSTYASILSGGSITRDCYGILININSIAAATTAKDSLCKIGIDTSGGTTYIDFIPHLICSCAGTFAQGGVWYYFPVFIPSGSQLAASGSTNNATVGTQRVAVWLYGAPSNLKDLKYGMGVEAIGQNTSLSCGTGVTSGTTSEGSWTLLGTTTHKCFAWQWGMGINDTTMSSGNIYTTDISYGDGTNQIILGQDRQHTILTVSEDLNSSCYPPMPVVVPAGGSIYGRMQCSGTADSSLTMVAYGVY